MKKFRMKNSNPTPTSLLIETKLNKEEKGSNVDLALSKKLVGNLMYLSTATRDIMFEVISISRIMETPNGMNWQVGKRILRYIS
jgi:hypothetical protein